MVYDTAMQPYTCRYCQCGFVPTMLARPSYLQGVSPACHLRSKSYTYGVISRRPRITALRMHGGHSHGGHSHGHIHGPGDHHPETAETGIKGILQYSYSALKMRKQTILGVVLGALALVLVRTYRGVSRFTSTDIGVLGVIITFVLAVETTKAYTVPLRQRLNKIFEGWRHHRSLRMMQKQDSDRIRAGRAQAMSQTERMAAAAKDADQVTWVGIYANLALFVVKASAGVLGRSAALIADAGHTLSDLVSDAVTLWAVRMSALPPDDDHPYGHGRFEAMGSLGVSVLLLLTAWHIALHAYDKLQACLHLSSFPVLTFPWEWLSKRGGHGVHVDCTSCGTAPSLLAVGAAGLSIVVKEVLYQITATVGLRHKSQVLLANAWHHRSDAISSVMALGGIIAARAGLSALDPMAGILVTAMIGLTGMQIFLDCVNQLTDTVESDAIPGIRRCAQSVEGVIETSDIRARRMGPQMLVDLRIQVDNQLSASAAQQVADQVRWSIRRDFASVSEVLVSMKTEHLPCPVISALRPPSEIEQDVRTQIANKLADPLLTSVQKVTVHYASMQAEVEVLLRVESGLTIAEATEIARRVQSVVQGVKEVGKAQVHLDLTGTETLALPRLALI